MDITQLLVCALKIQTGYPTYWVSNAPPPHSSRTPYPPPPSKPPYLLVQSLPTLGSLLHWLAHTEAHWSSMSYTLTDLLAASIGHPYHEDLGLIRIGRVCEPWMGGGGGGTPQAGKGMGKVAPHEPNCRMPVWWPQICTYACVYAYTYISVRTCTALGGRARTATC